MFHFEKLELTKVQMRSKFVNPITLRDGAEVIPQSLGICPVEPPEAFGDKADKQVDKLSLFETKLKLNLQRPFNEQSRGQFPAIYSTKLAVINRN